MLLAWLQEKYSDKSGQGWAACTKMLGALLNNTSRSDAVAEILDGYCVVLGTPTWYEYDVCVGPGQTMADEGAGVGAPYFEQCAVWGVDQAGVYRVEDLMHLWKSYQTQFSDAGLAATVGDMAGYFKWLVTSTPTSPIGRPGLKVLISGNLFDPATSYSWTQQMRSMFPDSTLITWQGVGHTMPLTWQGVKNLCTDIAMNYLQTGELPPDGYVCIQNEPTPVGF